MVYYRTFIWFCIYLMLVIATVAAQKDCHKVVCPGPLAHYRSIGCTPVYDHKCCAWQYNCDSLYKKTRSRTKCYFNGHQYEIGERIRGEDVNVCEKKCTCAYTGGGFADFTCTDPEQFCPPYKPSRDGCYQMKSSNKCCSTEEYCPDQLEKKNGTVLIYENAYVGGDFSFVNHSYRYVCGESPTGLLECLPLNNFFWLDIHAEAGFNKKCAPVYLLNKKNMIELRRHSWRCQVANDIVIDVNYTDPEESKRVHGPLTQMHCLPFTPSWSTPYCIENSDSCRLVNPDGPPGITYDLTYGELCQFGQMTMHIGDRLNDIEYDADSCIVCVCEIPPVPTCILLQDVACSQSSARKRSLFRERQALE